MSRRQALAGLLVTGTLLITTAQGGSVEMKTLPCKHFEIPQFDIAHETQRHVIVDRQKGKYLGQADTVLLADNKTIVCVYPHGHGAKEKKNPRVFVKRSTDGGLTWGDYIETPKSFYKWKNAPVIHRVTDEQGKERLVITVSYPSMRQSFSEDNGQTWSEFKDLFPASMKGKPGFKGHAPPKDIMPVDGAAGHYIAMYHDHAQGPQRKNQEGTWLVQIKTEDGGRTWSKPRIVSDVSDFKGAWPVEPGLARSPDGKQILAVCNEFKLKYPALMMTSDDEGQTWTKLKAAPNSLAGQRHRTLYLPDGRLIMTFRDRSCFKNSPSFGDFVLWVGTYEDITQGREGQYRVRLLDNKMNPGETGYSGLELLPDGTIVSTTYCSMEPKTPPIIISVRYKIEELDAMLKAASDQ